MVVTGHLNPSADGKLAGGFQTGICIRPAEAENSETGIIALFFYADTAEDPVDDLAGRFSDSARPVSDPFVIPLDDVSECRRHVFQMARGNDFTVTYLCPFVIPRLGTYQRFRGIGRLSIWNLSTAII